MNISKKTFAFIILASLKWIYTDILDSWSIFMDNPALQLDILLNQLTLGFYG